MRSVWWREALKDRRWTALPAAIIVFLVLGYCSDLVIGRLAEVAEPSGLVGDGILVVLSLLHVRVAPVIDEAELSTKSVSWTGNDSKADSELAACKGVRVQRTQWRRIGAKGAFLAKAQWNEVDITGADFSFSEFRLAQLLRTHGDQSRFLECVFGDQGKSADSDGQKNLTNRGHAAVISLCDFVGADFSRSAMYPVKTVFTNFNHALFKRGRYADTSFGPCTLEQADLFLGDFQNGMFDNCTLQGTYFTATICGHAKFLRSSLNQAKFDGAELNDVVFDHCLLLETLFSFANLENSAFKTCNLGSSLFINSLPRKVDFSACEVQRAKFDNCGVGSLDQILRHS